MLDFQKSRDVNISQIDLGPVIIKLIILTMLIINF
jgi:hypothetical protein